MESQREIERREAQSEFTMRVIFAPIAIVALAIMTTRSLDDQTLPHVLIVVAVTLSFVIAFWVIRSRTLRRLGSREALGQHISRTRLMRFRWVCLEYVIAKNVARGSYFGERPAEFRREGDLAYMRLVYRTRGMQRGFLVAYAAAMVLGIGTLIWLDSRHPLPGGLATPLLIMTLVTAALAAIQITAARGSRAERELARLIESTLGMGPEERWATLVGIAGEPQMALPHS